MKFLFRAFGIGLSIGILYLGIMWITLPDIGDATTLFATQSAVITDRNGVELYRIYEEEDRTIIYGDQIPDSLKHAMISIEDERFYDRGCLDFQALGRVVFRFGQSGGASTLTRQLARNALHLQRDSLISRKVKELILGCKLETLYEKDKILELYLNWIPFGHNAYGVEQASQRYFGKSAKDLTLAQSSVLAALPQRPSYFSPYGSHVHTQVSDRVKQEIEAGEIDSIRDIPEDEIVIGLLGTQIGSGSDSLFIGGRTNQVLSNMVAQGFIQEDQEVQALKELSTMTFKASRESIRAPHFVLWVRDQVEEMFDEVADEALLYQKGVTIETTLDYEMQKAAEESIAARRDEITKTYGAHNIALVALDPDTREVLAYVGSADFSDEEHDGKVDMARAPRQPGSSFKPFVYATAFTQGYSPATVLFDVPTKFGNDTPQNYEGEFWGLMNARKALGASRNIPAIKAFFLAGGEDAILSLVTKLGVPTPRILRDTVQQKRPDFEYGWPLALGAAETPLIEMVNGYATFADEGRVTPIVSIRRIRDSRGSLLPCSRCQEETVEKEQVLDPRIAYQITSILSDVAARPNGYWQSILSIPGYQAAAKTGTSNKCLERGAKDECRKRKPDNVWTIGYTPEIAAGVWIGNAASDPLSDRADGLTVAAPIWKDFMTRAHKKLKNPRTSFHVPEGISQPQISLLSGQLPTQCTPVQFRAADVFLREKAPMEGDTACVTLEVDKVTGLLASDECPTEAREMQSFFAPRSEIGNRFPEWAQAIERWARGGTGSHLPLPLAPTEKCEMTPERSVEPKLQILFPARGGTASYPSFQPEIDFEVGSQVREVVYTLDGKQLERATEAPFTPALRMPASVDKSGSHTLEVTLIDVFYNTVTDKTSFRFEEDRSNPEVRLISPIIDQTAAPGDDITIRAKAEDEDGGVKIVEFYLNDTLLSRHPKEPYELIYTLKNLAPGTHTIRAIATDFAGNTGEDSIEMLVE